MTVAITASGSENIGSFGLSSGHLKDTVIDILVEVLSFHMNVNYGGDLREYDLLRWLPEMVMKYTRWKDWGKKTRATNHFAWPEHIQMSTEELEAYAAELERVVDLELLGTDGEPLSLSARGSLQTRTPTALEWAEGLTAMRRRQCSNSDARVVFGGRITGFRGAMPGVAEEALLSLRAGQPLFLIGGFGGAARYIAETLGLADRWSGSRLDWPGHTEFSKWTCNDLNNGLSREENEFLATTPFTGQVVLHILFGLSRLRRERYENETELTPA